MKHAIDFGKVLKSVRKRKRITQEVLADTCGLDRTYIGLMERGKRSPTLETLCKLSVGLNVLPSDLLGFWESSIAARWREHIHNILDVVMNLREPSLGARMIGAQDVHISMSPEGVFSSEHAVRETGEDQPELFDISVLSHAVVDRIIRILLMSFLRTHIRKNSPEKSEEYAILLSELTLLLADETLGLTADQNQRIVHLLINMVCEIDDTGAGEDDEDISETY